MLEEEIAHRIAIKFLVEEDASEKKSSFMPRVSSLKDLVSAILNAHSFLLNVNAH